MAQVTYQNLEEIGSAYVDAAQAEKAALFQQGDIVLEAINQGFQVKQVVYHCASLTRRKARTVFRRYAVAKTFPPDKRDEELDWELHAMCAATDNPYQWLEIAAEGYTDERGEHHGHTTRTLKAAIKAAGGDPDKGKPIVWLDDVEARVVEVSVESGQIILNTFVSPTLLDIQGQVVQITLMQAHAPELENVA